MLLTPTLKRTTAALLAAATLSAGLSAPAAYAADPTPAAPDTSATPAADAVKPVDVKIATGAESVKTIKDWTVPAGSYTASWKADDGHDKLTVRVLDKDGKTAVYTGEASKTSTTVAFKDKDGKTVDDITLADGQSLGLLGYGTVTFTPVDTSTHEPGELKDVTAEWADATGKTTPVTGFDPTKPDNKVELPKSAVKVDLKNLPAGWTLVSNTRTDNSIVVSVKRGATTLTYTFTVTDHTTAELKGVTAKWKTPDGKTGNVDGFDPVKGGSFDTPFQSTVDVANLPVGWSKSETTDAASGARTVTVTNIVDPTVKAVYTFTPEPYDLSQLKGVTADGLLANGDRRAITGFDASKGDQKHEVSYDITGIDLRGLPDGWTKTPSAGGFTITVESPNKHVKATFTFTRKHMVSELSRVAATGVKRDGTRIPIDGFDASKGAQSVDVANGLIAMEFTNLPVGWKAETTNMVTTFTADDGATFKVTWKPAAPAKTIADAFDKAYTDAVAKAKTNGVYEEPGFTELRKLVDEATPEHENLKLADETILTDLTKRLSAASDALLVAKWTFRKETLHKDDDGAYTTKDGYRYGADPSKTKLEAIGGDGTKVTLEPHETKVEQLTTDPLGIVTHTGTLEGMSAKGQRITIPYRFKDGTRITLKDGKTGFTWDAGANAWTATGPAAELDKTNKPKTSTVELSNGVTLPITWDDPTVIGGDGTTRIWQATGTATGTTGLDQPVTVNVIASRAYDPSLKLALTRRGGDGKTTTIALDGGDITDVETLDDKGVELTAPTLPYEATGDQYQIAATAGNQTDVTTKVTATLGDNGTRLWTVTIGFKNEQGLDGERTVTVSQPFDKPARHTDNPLAALKDLQVNGVTIKDWDPDVLDYTIDAGQDERVLVQPIAADGQTVTAGDARQTAYTTVQSWTVSKDGQTRVYTVTLVRDHTEPTADEAFQPKDALDMDGQTQALKDNTTTLKSIGYTVNGQYTPVEDESYTIPENGVFAYESYKGQVVKVGVGRTHGMTFQYDLGVLAPDGYSYGNTTRTVTYLTAATHKAELTAIKVDGKPISDFKPDKLEYTVPVDNPNKYVVTADWDKQTGMSLTNHKDGRTVTLTATSADGLDNRVYTVKVESKPVAALAQTGIAAIGLIAGMLAVLGIGGLATWATRRRRDDATGQTNGDNRVEA